jgi:hypothetical protein
VHFSVQQHCFQAAYAFLAGRFVEGLGSQKVENMREVSLALSEDQMKRL